MRITDIGLGSFQKLKHKFNENHKQPQRKESEIHKFKLLQIFEYMYSWKNILYSFYLS